jgi:hypothetical protein
MSRPFTEQLTEGQSIAGIAAGATSLSSTSVNSGNLNMGTGPKRVRAIFNFSGLSGSPQLTLSIRASATSGGTYSDITGAGVPTTKPKITAQVPVGGAPVSIEIRADQLDAGKPFVQGFAQETNGGTVIVDIILVGDCNEYSPGNQFDSVTWTKVVVAS